MPIRGVTDNVDASFPQIGTIHKGAARTKEDLARNSPGGDLEGFRFTSDYPEIAAAFAEIYGEEFVEPEVKDEVVQEVIDSCERHIKKYGFRKMSIEEFDKLCKGE